MFVPDLGADLVRVLKVCDNDSVSQQQVLQLLPGSTPRHGAFARVGGKTYFYVFEQNANKLVSFRVDYLQNGTVNFHQLVKRICS